MHNNQHSTPAKAGVQKAGRPSHDSSQDAPTRYWTPAFAGVAAILSIAACTPTVKVEAPDKPIEINMNIKIEQEVRVKVDKDLDAAFANDPALFGTGTTAQPKKQ